MTERERKRRGLPQHCECGGKILYDLSYGRVWSCCDTCTGIAKVPE
jgi:hypothetical protein